MSSTISSWSAPSADDGEWLIRLTHAAEDERIAQLDEEESAVNLEARLWELDSGKDRMTMSDDYEEWLVLSAGPLSPSPSCSPPPASRLATSSDDGDWLMRLQSIMGFEEARLEAELLSDLALEEWMRECDAREEMEWLQRTAEMEEARQAAELVDAFMRG